MLTIAYGVIAWGYLVGKRLRTPRIGVATGLGVVLVVALTQVLGLIPVVGELITGGLLLAGLGAVVVTYFGVRPFEPVLLPE